MKKYLLSSSIVLSIGLSLFSMRNNTLSIEDFNTMLQEQNNHGHTENSEECEHACKANKFQIWKQIQNIKSKISKGLIGKEEGNKQIKDIKKHWNSEHPNDQFGN